MFKLQPAPTFWASVDIPLPGGETAPLELELRWLPEAERRELVSGLSEDTPGVEVLRKLVVGWRDVDAEFSDEALATLSGNYPGAAWSVLREYPKHLAGAKRKN